MITGAETAHLALRPALLLFEGRLPVVTAAIASELGMRDDQVVQATVQVQPEGLRLELKGRPVPLPRDLALAWQLQGGDEVQFRVRRQAGGSVVLQPLLAKPGASATSAATNAPTNATTSTATPPASGTTGSDAAAVSRLTQLSFRPPTLEGLGTLLQSGSLPELAHRLASPELRATLGQWLSLRPQMATLTAQALQHYLIASGWMTEAALAQGRGAGLLDLKSVLRLLQREGGLRASDGERLGEAIDDIEGRQLAAADLMAGREGIITLMLPFGDAAPVTLQFKRSKQQPDQTAAPLVIDLHTRSPELGELWLQTHIHADDRVDLVMWAQRQDIAAAAQAQAAGLQQALEGAGLQMTRLQIIHGPRPADADAWQPPASGSIVDRSC